MTALDLFLNPELLEEAHKYLNDVQKKDHEYIPFITDADPPATHLNEDIMNRYRDEMKKYYFDPEKYDTYMEQLGIAYPTVRED